ncbi:MAG: hypothetical protein M3081_13175 [Gemmatimonadota bacterium]|nr:hypothetical protein [Gemmatimonadota bacterium]
MIATAIVYLGAFIALVGLTALIRPIRLAKLTPRRRGTWVMLVGVALAIAGLLLPAPSTHVAVARTRLDEMVPDYQFSELHEIHINAPPERVFKAPDEVTAGEIRFYRMLTWIRRFGRGGRESILNVPQDAPVLAVALRTMFTVLARDADRELVFGGLVIAPDRSSADAVDTPDTFRTLSAPGYAKAAMNFRLEPDEPGGTRLSTETRIFATDPAARRRFAAYWRLIYPGSALIRRGWLQAVRRRAEQR